MQNDSTTEDGCRIYCAAVQLAAICRLRDTAKKHISLSFAALIKFMHMQAVGTPPAERMCTEDVRMSQIQHLFTNTTVQIGPRREIHFYSIACDRHSSQPLLLLLLSTILHTILVNRCPHSARNRLSAIIVQMLNGLKLVHLTFASDFLRMRTAKKIIIVHSSDVIAKLPS